MEFKDMLKTLRLKEKLTQRELAKKLGISNSAIAMYESGNRHPDFETEELIADYFNVDLNTLRGIVPKDYSYIDTDLVTDIMLDKKMYSLMESFNKLNPKNQERILDMANALLESQN